MGVRQGSGSLFGQWHYRFPFHSLDKDDMEPLETGRMFESLGGFAQYLFIVIQRQVTDIHSVVWCPRWWEHPEALFRLQLLWELFESAVENGYPAVSQWLLMDVDQHMQQLWSPDGPFKYCSVRNGHKDHLQPLPCDWDAAPASLFTPNAFP